MKYFFFILFGLSFFLFDSFGFRIIPFDGSILAQGETGVSMKRAWISGKYYMARKQMVVGATVKVTMIGNRKVFLTSTDMDGKWSLDNLPEGNYVVELFKEGFQYIEKRSVEIRFPFKTVIELQANPSMETLGNIRRWGLKHEEKISQSDESEEGGKYIIQGTISAKEGTPIIDAEIKIRNISREVNPYKVYSRAAGEFTLEKLQKGHYEFLIMMPGYLPIHTIIEIDSNVDIIATMLLQPLNYEATPSELLPLEEPIHPQ